MSKITDVYTALYDPPGGRSGHVGVFSTEKKAQAACQEHQDEVVAATGKARVQLSWKDDTARLPDGDSYCIVMTRLDWPTGSG